MAKVPQSRKTEHPHANALDAFDALDPVAWSTVLMLASLIESKSVDDLCDELVRAGITDEAGGHLSPLAMHNVLARIEADDLIWRDGTVLGIDEELTNFLVGHAAISIAETRKRIRAAKPSKSKSKTRKKPQRKKKPASKSAVRQRQIEQDYSDRKSRFVGICKYILKESGIHPYGFYGGDRSIHEQRELRALYWLGDAEEINERLTDEDDEFAMDCDFSFAWQPFHPAQFDKLEHPARHILLQNALATHFRCLEPADDLLQFISGKPWPSFIWLSYGEHLLLRGELSGVETLIGGLLENAERSEKEKPNNFDFRACATQLRASLHFLHGDDEAAITAFDESMRLMKGKSRRKKICPHGLGASFYCLSLCRVGDPDSLKKAARHATWGTEMIGPLFPPWLDTIGMIADSLGPGGAKNQEARHSVASGRDRYLFEWAPNFGTLLFVILDRLHAHSDEAQQQRRQHLTELCELATEGGYIWVAHEAASLLRDLGGTVPPELPDHSVFPPNAPAFSSALQPVPEWEQHLLGLEKIAADYASRTGGTDASGKSRTGPGRELVWILDVFESDDYRESSSWFLHVYERSITKTGRVSKGKKVALRRLKEAPEKFPFLTEQDRSVLAFAQPENNWRHNSAYAISEPAALLALVGHPRLFNDIDKLQPIDLVKSAPRLEISDPIDGAIELELVPDVFLEGQTTLLVPETANRYVIYEISPVHQQLAELITPGQATRIPLAARERLLASISGLAGEINIGADQAIGESAAANAEAIDGDSTPHLRLVPGGLGLDARLIVRPVPNSSIEHPPGEGKAILFAAVDTRRYQASRDLEAEKSRGENAIERCPTLRQQRGELSDPWQWHLENPGDCLQLLSELRHLDESQIIVEWPEGQPFRVLATADTKQLELSIRSSSNSNWLKADGELKVSDDLVLSMRQLLDLIDTDNGNEETTDTARRGFVKIGDNEYLALSENLRRQLTDLQTAAAISGADDGTEVAIHPLALLALENLGATHSVEGKKSKVWREQLKRIEAARDHHPNAPATLRAELRPYQLDGYRWLSRLALLGAGACLADDMGLGKTVQSLALLIERAPLGPSLVIAPTSVATNWINETQGFAPTLNPLRFGDGDRSAMLDDLRPGDLVILSYGLLHTEIKKLAAIEWNTIILDEAQAIKNRTTQRSKAAMKLKAGFRIITTGTPVENRLAELHNLFHFINPGLLGTWKRFQQTFADPIENNSHSKSTSDRASQRLRRLVSPFLLRRLKSEVLRDLPPRTDIELSVEPSAAETAFYEALRQKALEDIESGGSDDGPGTIRILAQLTRLRRACCHPQLIDPDTDITSSKHKVLADTLEEILAGGHKVLVFSQFVDHLSFVREYLETKSISYQYLDGSTPAKKRQQAVDAFQSGDGDVFLISLKAGGFGLNLTAADYVIHLDPWWNPAAEDQASDRAHRIGQQRPVTVYRLIVRDTIEEKIVALHHRKRELADSLLEGTNKAAKLTPDDMLELLRS